MKPRTWYVLSGLLIAAAAGAQHPGANYDEAKVPKYTLPDPLVLSSGERVRDAATWRKQRRPELLALFASNVYGRTMGKPDQVSFEVSSIDKAALGGNAVRKQVTAYFNANKGRPHMDILIYLPANAPKPVPLFLGLNFQGNHAVNADPGIKLGEVWERAKGAAAPVHHMATEASRGATASRWQVEKVLARGYGLATIYYGDIEPDFPGRIGDGIRPLFFKPGQSEPAPDEWGAIGAWAWGLSRALDYLERDKDVDAKRVAVIGHSRLGKTALWAGAQDERFAMVVSNCSGEGGAALARRKFGERTQDLNTHFPHWFCGNYRKFNGREEDLPVDQHMLISLIAPRPVYVASAEQDLWADPHGEFLSAVAAGPVYRLFGKKGLETGRMPGIHQPIMNTIGYHIRAGKHDITAYDWDRYLDFADKNLKRGR